MKVICVNNENYAELIIDEKYDTIGITMYDPYDFEPYYRLDISNAYFFKKTIILPHLYPKKLFITLQEHRDKKLEEIGI